MDFDEIDVGRRSLWCCWILLIAFVIVVFAAAITILSMHGAW